MHKGLAATIDLDLRRQHSAKGKSYDLRDTEVHSERLFERQAAARSGTLFRGFRLNLRQIAIDLQPVSCYTLF
jgi:hypothetical protein